MSGWQDSNLRPPRPKRGAMTGLRYTPKMIAHLRTAKIHSFCKKTIKLGIIIPYRSFIISNYIRIIKTYKHSFLQALKNYIFTVLKKDS